MTADDALVAADDAAAAAMLDTNFAELTAGTPRGPVARSSRRMT